MLGPAVLAVLLAQLAAPSFGEASKTAERISNLGRFLEEYLGDCVSNQPAFDKAGCESSARAFQKSREGRLLLFELADASEQLRFAEWDGARKAFRLHLTPFFSERGLALSAGRPRGLDRRGLPIVKNVPVWVQSPGGERDFGFRRALERGMLRVELLVRANRPWQFERSGDVLITEPRRLAFTRVG